MPYYLQIFLFRYAFCMLRLKTRMNEPIRRVLMLVVNYIWYEYKASFGIRWSRERKNDCVQTLNTVRDKKNLSFFTITFCQHISTNFKIKRVSNAKLFMVYFLFYFICVSFMSLALEYLLLHKLAKKKFIAF